MAAHQLSPLEGVLQMQLFQRVIFGGDDGFSLGEQAVGRSCLIADQLDHAACGQVSGRRGQLVDHDGVGRVEILRVAGIGDQHRMALAAAAQKTLRATNSSTCGGVAWQKVKC